MTAVRLIASTVRKLHALPHLAAVPEWIAARDALAAVQKLTLDEPRETLDDIGTAIATACREGVPADLEDLTSRVVDIERRAEAQTMLHTARNRAESILLGELDTAAVAAVPAVLRALNDDMAAVAEEFARIPRLEDLDDAETADSAGRYPDFLALRELRDRYSAIRAAQATCYEHTSTAGSHHPVLLIRAQETLMPAGEWVNSQRGSSYRNEHGELVQPMSVPWPTDFAPTVHAALTAPRFLDWLLEHPGALAHVWVPTPAEILTETKRLDALLEQAHPSTTLATRERIIH